MDLSYCRQYSIVVALLRPYNVFLINYFRLCHHDLTFIPLDTAIAMYEGSYNLAVMQGKKEMSVLGILKKFARNDIIRRDLTLTSHWINSKGRNL